jgi:WD40 repeat protein
MPRCCAAFAVAALPLLALLLSARGADEPKPVAVEGNGFESLAFSPDGKSLAVATAFDGVELRDPLTGKKTATVRGDWTRGDVAFSPNGAMLATGYNGVARRGDFAKSPPLRDKTFAALGFKEAVRVWDVRTGEPKARLQDIEKMEHVIFSPDGKKLAAAGYGAVVRVWDLATEKLVATWSRDTEERVTVMAFDPDGTKLAVGTRAGPIYLVNALSGGTAATLDQHTKPVLALAFAPDGKYLHSAGANGAVRRWDLVAGGAELTAIKHYAEITQMTFSPDRRFVACGDERGGVTVWDAVTGERRLDFYGPPDAIRCLAFGPDGKLLASGTNRSLSASANIPSVLAIRSIDLPAKK